MWLSPYVARALLIAGLGLAAVVMVGIGVGADPGAISQAFIQPLSDRGISNC